MTLRERWAALAGTTPVADALYADVLARYGEPHRAYHGPRHVDHVLATIDELDAAPGEALRWAAWLHDVVYDTRAADNEARSAEYARERLPALGVAAADVERVAGLVLATATHEAFDGEAAVLLDADLAILGADEAAYDAYAAAIRREYAWVPDDLYRAGRAAVLRGFLDREHVFATSAMREAADDAARANLARELASL